MITFIIILSAINLTLGQSISGSTSKCSGTGADPVTCGKATVLRGQSHIGIPAACFNRVDSGPCSQDLVRIYYDHHTYTCKVFSYSGCGGNANRFVSIKNCYKLCHPYYRQRFISLSTDQGTEKPGADGAGGDGGGGGDGATGSTGATETTPTTEGTQSTTPLISTSTLPDMGVLYFMGPMGDKLTVKPEIQVVHEYDSFAQPQGQGGYQLQPGHGYQTQPQMGYQGQPSQMNMMPMPGQPGQGRSMGQGGGAPGKFGYLANIQHENYNPVAGSVPNGQGGFAGNPNTQQKITSID